MAVRQGGAGDRPRAGASAAERGLWVPQVLNAVYRTCICQQPTSLVSPISAPRLACAPCPLHSPRYLSDEHDPTTIAVLVGMAAQRRGSMDPTVTRMLFLHLPARHPTSFPELELSPLVQVRGRTGAERLLYDALQLCSLLRIPWGV